MKVPSILLPLVLLALLLAAPSQSVPKSYFYRYGEDAGDTQLPDEDEVSSTEIGLRVPIVFYGQIYQSIFVSKNILCEVFSHSIYRRLSDASLIWFILLI